MKVCEYAIRVVAPRPDVQVPDLEIVFLMQSLPHQGRGDRVSRPQAVRNNELDSIQLVCVVRHSFVEKNLRLRCIDIVREVAAIDMVVTHRAMVLVNETVGDHSWVAGGDG